VDIKGKLGSFRDEMQVLVEKMNCLKSTTQEVALWDKRAAFYRDVLSQPWVLRRRDIRKCQKEAERSNEENERKRKRLKAVTEGDVSRNTSKPPTTTKTSKKTSRGKATVDLREIIERSSGVGAYNALGL
jgi:endo-1,3(4)-beta-glucanase